MRRFGFLLSAPLALVLTVPGLSRADFHIDCLGIATGHATVQLVANPGGTVTFTGILNCSGATSLSIDALELGSVTPSGTPSPFIDPCSGNPGSNDCTIPPVNTVVASAPQASCAAPSGGCLGPISTSATIPAPPAGAYQVGMLVSVNVPGGPDPHPHALRFGRWMWTGAGQPIMICVPLGGPMGSTGFCT